MSKHTSKKIAFIVLYLFGIFEIMGLMMLFAPEDYLPKDFAGQSVFWGMISGLYGVSRIIAGYAIMKNKKWGLVFGMMLSLTTMIVAPTIEPFGIIDLVLAIIITVSLLYTYYGEEEIIKE